jgi:hypothetical protein
MSLELTVGYRGCGKAIRDDEIRIFKAPLDIPSSNLEDIKNIRPFHIQGRGKSGKSSIFF